MKKWINKLPLWMAILWVTFISCEQEDHPLSELKGTIRFGGISLEFASIRQHNDPAIFLTDSQLVPVHSLDIVAEFVDIIPMGVRISIALDIPEVFLEWIALLNEIRTKNSVDFPTEVSTRFAYILYRVDHLFFQ